jgi:DNA-binding response OmpR family regulator
MKLPVLSINGNKPFNYILQSVLSKNYYVTIASDPITGLKQMKMSGKINLVIVDTDAFEEEGIEFIEYIKSSLLFQMPVIVLTSNETDAMKQKLFQLNVNNVFIKPFDPLMLVKRVNKILDINLLNITKP